MTATDIETFDLTDLDFDHEPPCEHSQHLTKPEHHDDGPARWYKQPHIGACGCYTGGVMVCDKWRQLVSSGKHPLRCTECGRMTSAAEAALIRFDPITDAH